MEINDVFADAKARRGRWESGQKYWRRFVEKFLVGKRNFLFKGSDGEEILTGESFSDVVKRYSSLREKNQIDSFKEEAKAQYGNAPRAVQIALTHILYAYKLIERAETANAVNNKKEFVCCIGDLGELDSDLYWDGVAGTGSGYNKPGESVGFFFDVLVHLAQSNKTNSLKEVNDTILAFCKGRYNDLQTGGKWMADVLFWYVDPDEYEPIISQAAKKQIARRLKGYVEDHPEYSSNMIKDDFKVNKVINLIRKEFVKQGWRNTFNFYDEDVVCLWGIASGLSANNEDGFRQWLEKEGYTKGPRGTAQDYTKALKNPASRFAKDLYAYLLVAGGSVVNSIYEMSDKDDFDSLKDALLADKTFNENDRSGKYGKRKMSAALKCYSRYLAQKGDAHGDGDASRDENNAKNGENTMTSKKQTPLNQIFYGPPGTGKTYHVVPAALEIIEGQSSGKREEQKVRFDALRKKGQIAMVTFHQNFSYEDFIEGIKPVLDPGGNALSYEMVTGIFKEIADEADKNRKESEVSDKRVIDVEDLVDEYAQYFDNFEDVIFIDENQKWKIERVSRFSDGKFRSFSVSNGKSEQPLTLKVIQKHYGKFDNGEMKSHKEIPNERSSERGRHGNSEHYFNLFHKLKEFKEKNSISFGKESVEKKDYVLIIDEINRGNISAIFGELITLLEDDKRLGRDFALSLDLPYSKEEFGVPDNLHIIGTMNTADRSIAMLDTALRRRFHFVEMMPKPELLRKDVGGVDCEELLKEINIRIEREYDREHQIGHAFLINAKDIRDIKAAFQYKIIPLLQEYFFDDWEKIAKVLTSKSSGKNHFVTEKGSSNDGGEDGGKKLFEISSFISKSDDDDPWLNADNYKGIYGGNGGA